MTANGLKLQQSDNLQYAAVSTQRDEAHKSWKSRVSRNVSLAKSRDSTSGNDLSYDTRRQLEHSVRCRLVEDAGRGGADV